jgi:hypothetical protein
MGIEAVKGGRVEEWKDGRMEGWKGGRVEGWKGGRSVPDRWNLSDQGFDLLAEARSADMNLGWSVGRRSDLETSNGRVRERRLLRFLR